MVNNGCPLNTMKDGQFNIVLGKLAGNFREKWDGLSEKRGLNRRILKFEHQKSGISQQVV
jgi:hypothetical protein